MHVPVFGERHPMQWRVFHEARAALGLTMSLCDQDAVNIFQEGHHQIG